ncbi:uncharacterized protein FOMMEDRAFT_150622 [Fomitiporia mediterranea MF3/22]|uniref:uncharacterized protein n=1 Tax=Fomitiporia mediterranea (strain MF3/22) TaxID=694068 RepID=UPI0004407A19|nr:uncharacterized protein FOMMEDRAFT_150622 [Fomitiporia mediterranea MF3/22]EJD07995.1 hypothetical protein FOMMEDRAFT_150622 [Fomitiporia mediterranea MF3/22]
MYGGRSLRSRAGCFFSRGGKSSNTGTKRPYLQSSPFENTSESDLPRRKIWRSNFTDVNKTNHIIIRGCASLEGSLSKSAEFELEPGVEFPLFPTSEVPILQVEGSSLRGATGLVCKAKLMNPDISRGTESKYFAVKLVDSASRSTVEYRNFVMDVYNEYVNYCIFELGKQFPAVRGVIERCTATCFGLYRLGDYGPNSLPKFALITEHVGEEIEESWEELGDSTKRAVLNNLICLHALGFCHNDADERNVVYDSRSDTYKFIDLCTGGWHEFLRSGDVENCRGIRKCSELKIMWHTFNPSDKDASQDFEEEVLCEHNLRFRNLRKRLEREGILDMHKLAPDVKKLADRIESDC